MANTYKKIVITPNTAVDSSNSYPEIRFSGGDQFNNTDIYLRVYTSGNGTIAFEGNSGQIIAFSSDMDEDLFVISDSGGIPCFQVNTQGNIIMNEFIGRTAIGKNKADYKLDVNGSVNAAAFVINGVALPSDTTIAEAAFDQANTVWNSANSAFTYAANDVMLAANSAYGEANVTMNVGITTGGTFTPTSKRRALNFIEGTGITISIVDDADLNTANVTITSTGGDTTIAEAAFVQANTVWDSANSNYTFAANDVMLAANSAYAKGNTTYTYAANNVMLAANSAYAKGNTTYTYAANNVMLAANSAFSRSNVANTLANTRTVNFIIDGGGSEISTGTKGAVIINRPFNIDQWTLLADQSGSIVVDVQSATYTAFPTSVSMVGAGTKPTLSTAQKNQSAPVSWTSTSAASGNAVVFVVDSVTTVTRVTVSLKLTLS